MKNTNKRMKTTITLKQDTWEELQMIKIKGGYDSIDEVIKILLGKK